jgi:ResB-like family
MLDRIIRFFSSLKLTVVCLMLGVALVFWGTMAQVHLGLYKAQNEFFRSYFIFWQPAAGVRIPIFPGGYLLGGLLLINLFTAHIRYYQPGKRKIGIAMIHLGVVLLLVGQFLTDFLAAESSMHLRNGETKNYSESDREYELAVIDTTDADSDKVVAIPQHILARKGAVTHKELPFTVQVKTLYANSELSQKSAPGFERVKTSAGVGGDLWWRELPHETVMDRRDGPSDIVELIPPQGASLGTFLVSAYMVDPQTFTYAGRTYQMSLRPERFYNNFSLHLLEFRHDKYPGTDIPKNFSSRVRLQNLDTGEDREVLIFMNNPLRYGGETFYQASFDADDRGSVLQVVHNPSWLTPYLACIMVGLGLLYQFLSHLIPFLKRRLAA